MRVLVATSVFCVEAALDPFPFISDSGSWRLGLGGRFEGPTGPLQPDPFSVVLLKAVAVARVGNAESFEAEERVLCWWLAATSIGVCVELWSTVEIDARRVRHRLC